MKAFKYIFIIISVVTIAGFIFYQNRLEPSPQQPSSKESPLSETDKFLQSLSTQKNQQPSSNDANLSSTEKFMQKLDEIDRQKELATKASGEYLQIPIAITQETQPEKPLNHESIEGRFYKYNSRAYVNGKYEYNYDVEGFDNEGDEVVGNCDMHGKYGSCAIIKENGESVPVDAEWVSYGVINATDEDGNFYEIRP